MISLFLAVLLSQSPAGAEPAIAPVPVVVPAVAAVPADPAVEAKKVVKNDDRTGCVEQTGSRIKRRDKATCNNGRSISQEDIERAGGSIAPYGAPPIPAAAGH